MPDSPQDPWTTRYEQWLKFLREVIAAVEAGRAIPLGPAAEPLTPHAAPESTGKPAKVVLCPPHPDDEALNGALAQRLRRDSGAAVTSVAITLGRHADQKPRRLRELESACRALDFKLVLANPPYGLEDRNVTARHSEPGVWAEDVRVVREIFDRELPDLVMLPHARDFHPTHVCVHSLVEDALGEHLERTGRGPVLLAETEYWHQMETPNLMIGLTPEFVAAQLVGIAEHGDEMRRNPYHLLHACRLMDNVRRGSEVVGGRGAAARSFAFAEIYNVALMLKRERVESNRKCIVDPEARISLPWLKEQFWPEGA